MATLRTPLTNLLANEYGFICFFFNIFLARLDFLYYLCTDMVVRLKPPILQNKLYVLEQAKNIAD